MTPGPGPGAGPGHLREPSGDAIPAGDHTSTGDATRGSGTGGAPAPLLEVRDLRTWFRLRDGTRRAVDGVSFTIEEGEAVALVGESGCGKSVTSLSIPGLVPPPGRIEDGSSIRFRGRELVGAPRRTLRMLRGDRIGMVFQQPSTALNPVLPVGKQIAEVLRHHRQMGRREAQERVVALLEEVGLEDPALQVRAYPHELSGGMQQRVVIAAALACEPDLLIADEPTSALDVTVQARILDLLASLRRRRGMAVLLVSHDLGVVARVCRKVVVMYAGRVVEEGPVDQVLRRPLHPYTRGLLDSLPRAGTRERLRPIAGTVPRSDRWPEGCRFRERCPSAWDRCLQEPPLLVPEGAGPRKSRCWLMKEPGRRKERGALEAAESRARPGREEPSGRGEEP